MKTKQWRLYGKKASFVALTVIYLSCSVSRSQRNTIDFISLDEELNLGKQLETQTLEKFDINTNQKVAEYFNSIGKEIGVESDWSGLTFTVHVLNDTNIIHFSLPGGYIYISTALIEMAENVNEVASIIAHEIGHVASRDGIEEISNEYSYALAAQSVIGVNPEIARHIVDNLFSQNTILDYSDSVEHSADKKGINYAWKTNYDPAFLLEIIKKIKNISSVKPARTDKLLSTHPSLSARMTRIRKELSKTPSKSSFKDDQTEFENIKNLLENQPQ